MDVNIDDLLREIAAAAGIPEPLREGEFTVKMFMATNATDRGRGAVGPGAG